MAVSSRALAADASDSTKSIVAGAVEAWHGSGRIRLAVVEDLSASSLTTFVETSVEP
ncbi:MAG: hypothetical protein R3D03_04715 [Geminicoccaceae bacterium]